MLKAYQSIYVTLYRWSYKNFGAGRLPQFKSLFNVSFLLIIMLTNALMVIELALKTRISAVNSSFATLVLFGAVFFMFLSHFILLNNRWLKRLNYNLAYVSKHNSTKWSVAILVNVIIICGFYILTI